MIQPLRLQTGICLSLLSLLFLFSCVRSGFNEKLKSGETQASPYQLTIFVDAPHFNYTSFGHLLRSLEASKERKIGHAWFLLQGKGETICGGHSGEINPEQPFYCDGVMNLMEHIELEPNPIKYLWQPRHDGFFQEGSGGHVPTYAVRVDLNEEQFDQIRAFIDPQNYNYQFYSLTEAQCVTFISHIASLAGLTLTCSRAIKIEPRLYFRGRHLLFWSDPCYQMIYLYTPDDLEKGLKKLTREQKTKVVFDNKWLNLASYSTKTI